MSLKKWFSALVAIAMMACLSIPALAEDTDAFLAQLAGTYDELFTVMCAPEYDQIWLDACTEAVGEENAQAYVDMLKAACVGRLYGEEAIAAYAAAPETTQFDCFFHEGVLQITIAGNQISGVDADGNEVFAHEYRYLGDDDIPDFAAFRVYESVDADAGEFTYFTFAPDTPAETFHIEFRHGSDREALAQLTEGPYAYWLAAGMLSPYTLEEVTDVIELFCGENAEEAEEAA